MTDAANPASDLIRLINGFQVSQAIHVAATLGIADLLAAGPVPVGSLAVATGTNEGSLYRLLRALASVGVFHEEPGRCFALTATGACLRTDAPDPVAPWAVFVGRPYFRRAWDELLHSVRTGENAFRHVHGAAVWDYRAAHPDEGVIFDRAMTGLSRRIGEAVAAAYDFSGAGSIVDVGGGEGAFLARILAAHPSARGALFDLPHVIAKAAPVLHAAGVADRCETIAGSFFDSVPKHGDVYILKAILHDWDDDAAIAILKVCRQSMRRHGKLLVVERLIAAPNEGPEGKFSDLNMLVSPGGLERSREEFAAMFAAADFNLAATVDIGSRLAIIEAVPQ